MVRDTLALNQQMNSANFSPITQIKERLHIVIGTVLGLTGAIAGGLFAVGYGGNPIKSLMLLLGVITMVVATLRPKTGLHLLLLSSAFLDIIKRLLIVFGMSSMSDVAGVLAVAPMILIGTFFGTCVLHPIFTKRMLNQGERRLALVALVIIGIVLAIGSRNATSLIDLLGSAVNTGAYTLLLPIVFVLYRKSDIDEFKKLLRFIVFIYAPVAVYGVYQYWFGLSRLEIDYLRSGLTVGGMNLYDIRPRPFSTMSSVHAYAVSMWFMVVISGYLALRRTSGFRISRWLPVVFCTAVLFSMARGTTIMTVANLLLVRMFKTRKGTLTFYAVAIGAVTTLIALSQPLLDGLDYLQSAMPGDKDWQQQAFRLGPLSDRLQGYQGVLLNPRMYTLFGHGASSGELELRYGEEGFSHDSLSQLLYRFGIAGVVLCVSVVVAVMWRLHSGVWRMRDPERKKFAAMLVSIVVFILFTHLGGGSYAVFPINLFIWLFLGLAVTVCVRQKETEQDPRNRTGRDVLVHPSLGPTLARKEGGKAGLLPGGRTLPGRATPSSRAS